MQETLYQPQLFPRQTINQLFTQPKPSLRVTIANDDKSALYRARRVVAQVEALCGNEINLVPVFWNFALLRHERLRDCARAEASLSDMIIISLRNGSELPGHVQSWLESLPVRAPAGQAALVAVIGCERGIPTEPHPHVQLLQQIAQTRGLDFFCNQDEWGALDIFQPALEKIYDRPVTRLSLIADQIPWIEGGINE